MNEKIPVKSTIITLTYDEFAAMLKEVKQAAIDNGSMTEPEGYSELEGKAVAVADDCLLKGMTDMETAALNWAFDYLNGHRKIVPPESPGRDDVARKLVAVARAAHTLADNSEAGAKGEPIHVPEEDFEQLSAALDALDALPELPAPYIGTGPAKAEHMLGLSEVK